MDSFFADRLNAKIKQHLDYSKQPDRSEGLRVYVSRHIDGNGQLLEDALVFLKRYWERVRPNRTSTEGASHEKLFMHLINIDKKHLEDDLALFLKLNPSFAYEGMQEQIDLHYENYTAKIRDEIAFLQAARRKDISDDWQRWLSGAVIPIVCVLLAAWLAKDAKSTLKEVSAVRKEVVELARANVVTSRLILDGAGRWGGMPAHKAAALKLLNEIELSLMRDYPNLHEEVESILRKTNADAEQFWKKYERLPADKRPGFLKDYVESGGKTK